nr:MAG TPA: hypothetical protein [Caudoviricetes sp.]DAX73155.1 MAG TPA: hypothetical protein [Caudoviricetes sp.]
MISFTRNNLYTDYTPCIVLDVGETTPQETTT